MAAAGPRHNAITPMLCFLAGSGLRASGGPGRYRDAGQTLWVARSSRYYLPDGMIACPPRYLDRQAIDNPTVVFEVLSPSTEAFDRTEKFTDYESIETVREIVFIDTRTKRVELYHRRERTEEWRFRIATTGTLTIPSLSIPLDVDALYADCRTTARARLSARLRSVTAIERRRRPRRTMGT